MQRLKRKLPQLDPILQLLSGNARKIHFDSWVEAFLSELIYVRPDLRPRDVSVRAEKMMRDYPSATAPQMQQVQLSIMEGNAGDVMRAMFGFGGDSGAALPATMV